MKYEVAVIQAADKSVAFSGYRYVLVLKHPESKRTRALAAGSIFQLTQALFNVIGAEEWQTIEAGLALTGAWKGNLEMDEYTASSIFAHA